MLTRLAAIACLLLVTACAGVRTYTFPRPVDTSSKEVRLLADQTFTTPADVVAFADFPGARLAGFRESGKTEEGLPLFIADIPAENQPINKSPWYAFSLAAAQPQEVVVRLTFPEGVGNRYQPKTAPSRSGPWTYVPYDRVDTSANTADVRLALTQRPLFLAGQEIVATDSIRRWLYNLPREGLTLDTIGRSVLGRPIWLLEAGSGKRDKRPTVVLFSRQHPPEVTGSTAFQAFVERLLEDDALAVGFRQNFRLVVFPVVNPDGVDEGHWRHNANGVDLNRDWAEYRQPEVRAVAEWLQRNTRRDQVVWGMDFHSTQYDVLYTHDPSLVEFEGADKLDAWTDALAAWAATNYLGASAKPGATPLGRPLTTGQDTLRIEPEGLGRPTSANWVAQHYGTVGVTYEVGDEQDRAYIRAKAQAAAEALMRVL